jgi:L-alanine-DL-glutamate epimerase-like enolase superfamily enzyme
MRITQVHLFRVFGRYNGPQFPFAGWQSHPSAVYSGGNLPDWTESMRDYGEIGHSYIEIDTDEGWSGLYGPVDPEALPLIAHVLRPLLLNADPMAHERLLDQMLRLHRHGRSGIYMLAVSAVDLALWDLKGKVLGQPVYRLLGGPTRSAVPVYASMLGFSDQPEVVGRIAREYREAGYNAQKWFFRCGPAHGTPGIERNLAMAYAVREAVGPQYPLMFDAFMSWDVPYAQQMLRELTPLRPRWMEEPLPPERVAALADLRQIGVPIAMGEHVYTRWQTKELLTAQAVDVLQNDPDWTGGITESLKIAALASAFDVPFIPHGHQLPPALHLVASQSPTTMPYVEYLVQLKTEKQWFHDPIYAPHDGHLELPSAPGLSFSLDETKIQRRADLHL